MDLAFAISATALKAGDNLKKTNEIIKDIVSKYGINKMHYSLGTFGSTLNVIIKFSRQVNSNAQFMGLVDTVREVPGSSDLAKALEESPAMFTEENGGRPNAKKILVVIIDNKSDSSSDDTEDAAAVAREAGIRVIPVGLDRADKGELQKTTAVEEDVLTPSDSDSAQNIAKDIIRRALNGKKTV